MGQVCQWRHSKWKTAFLFLLITEDEKVLEPAETPVPRRRTYSTDRDELSLIRTMIFDLQEEKDKLKQADVRLSDELYRKQKHLDDLYNLVDELKDVKVDKELLSVGFELKADKREVDAKVGREDFEHYMSLVDQSLRDLLQRLDGHVSCCLHIFYLNIYNLLYSISNIIGFPSHELIQSQRVRLSESVVDQPFSWLESQPAT